MTGPDRIAAFLWALGYRVPADHVTDSTRFAATAQQQPRRVPAIVWRAGRQISGPGAWVCDPPPHHFRVARPQVFRSLEEVVDHLTGLPPETETYVLQYVRTEPRIAVYLYAPEALALMESA